MTHILLHVLLSAYTDTVASITPPRWGVEYCDEYLSVCLSVREHISETTCRRNFTNFRRMLPVQRCGMALLCWHWYHSSLTACHTRANAPC